MRLVTACGLATALILVSASAEPPPLAPVNDFAYQLQKLDVDQASASRFDLIVTDPTRDGSDATRLSPQEVAKLQAKPGGGRRIVLAYLSIGEAEDYRGYWQKEWKQTPPAWLGPENPDWKGNYKVKYWMPEWQSVILGSPAAPLDRILAQGFDGVYLDIIDGFEFWQERGVPDAADRMVAFVRRLSAYAKTKHPGFLVFPQNGDSLEERPGYLEAIDGIGREDLCFIGDQRQDAERTAEGEKHLDVFVKAGKKVLLIEYCRERKAVKEVYERARRKGYVPYCTVRPLDRLTVNAGFEPD